MCLCVLYGVGGGDGDGGSECVLASRLCMSLDEMIQPVCAKVYLCVRVLVCSYVGLGFYRLAVLVCPFVCMCV